MTRSLALGALASALGLAATAAFAHVPLRNPSNGARLHWASPTSVPIVIAAAGSDDVPSRLHYPALRNAIAAWNAVPGSIVHLEEDASPTQQARSDWEADNLHTMLFDESNDSGFFPSGSGIVALTPVWFAGDGRITDADVLFNGSGFAFTTAGNSGRFDIQDVAAHELGHFLGLDHSGWAGATMFPYIDVGVVLQRSLSRDELLGLRDAYPATGFASIAGRIRRASNDAPVAGAHVVARDANGRTAAGALADAGGSFRLAGLDAGTYTVYATPLEGPVSSANLASGQEVDTDFESTVLGGFTVATGQSLSLSGLRVGADVAIRLGRPADSFPMRCPAGQTTSLQLRGAGLSPGSSLAASDPSVTVLATAWLGSAVSFQVSVPGGAAPGHVDLVATDLSGARSILPAPLEITPPSPSITGVVPNAGSPNGGRMVTISGAGFSEGLRVVIGDIVYPDGEPWGCTVIDPATIQLTTMATIGGLHDVVVIDPTGIEARAPGAFLVATTPVIESVFPPAGHSVGGTTVVLRGEEFAPGSLVRIAGVAQGEAFVDDQARIVFVTRPGAAGGPYVLEVENPGGAIATSTFTFVSEADPTIDSIQPARGTTGGGDEVTIHGSGFPADAEVRFGADPDTGAGGVNALSVSWVDASTLVVLTPPGPKGTASVLVRGPSTGQASALAGAFEYRSSGGGGSGGCSVSPLAIPRSPSESFAGIWWLAALFAVLLARVAGDRSRAALPVAADPIRPRRATRR